MGLEDEGGDGGGVRRGRTGAGEVRLWYPGRRHHPPPKNDVLALSAAATPGCSALPESQPITHVIEVNGRRTWRGEVFRNAHPENAVGRGAVTTVGHGVAVDVRRVDGEVFRRSDAGETVAANDPADVGRRLRRVGTLERAITYCTCVSPAFGVVTPNSNGTLVA